MVKICGTKFFGHDASVFILDTDKKRIFAVDTERITRIKHDGTDIEPILLSFKKSFSKVEYFCQSFETFNHPGFSWLEEVYRVRLKKLLRTIYHPQYYSDELKIKTIENKEIIRKIKEKRPDLLNEYLYLFKETKKRKNRISAKYAKKIVSNYFRKLIKKYGGNEKIDFYDHELTHAAAAYYFSPFDINEEALVFTLDGWGDGVHSKLFRFKKYSWQELSKSDAPIFTVGKKQYAGSLGTTYHKITRALGYQSNEEGKVEALAAMGKPDNYTYNLLRAAISVSNNKLSFLINTKKLKQLYEFSTIDKRAKKVGKASVAAALQQWLEDTVVDYLNFAYDRYPTQNICLGGGVLANVMLNLNIFERTSFKKFYIFPAPGDSGTAAGAAVLKAVSLREDLSWLKKVRMPYFGPKYTEKNIKDALNHFKSKIKYKKIVSNPERIIGKKLLRGEIIGIFQDAMEYGPRALGNRSILSSAINPDMKNIVNTIKGRPLYQPVCPIVLEEERERLFEESYPNKNMTTAFRMKKKFIEKLYSAVHVDGTARPEFINEKDNPLCYTILKEMKKKTGFGILLNTSFNVHGRTMVMSPSDAINDFLDCKMSCLFMQGYMVTRK